MADPSVIDPPEPRRQRGESIVCEFCECKLSLRGRIIHRSDKAKAILDLDDETDRLRKENERLTAALAEATKTPEPAPTPQQKKAWQSIGDTEE